jgi:two-component system sensor histidine kinase KdpD
VAVGPDARTLRLVHAGFRMAREQACPWIALHVAAADQETPEEADQARVWLQEARELGAEVAWIPSPNLVNGLVEEVRRRQPSVVLMGRKRTKGFWARMEHSKAQELLRRDPMLRVLTVPLDAPPSPHTQIRSVADALGVLAATTVLLAVCALFASVLAVIAGFPAIPAVFAGGVAFITHRWSRRASLPATLLSILIYLFLFAEPRFHLAFTDESRFLYFTGTLVVAQVLMHLMDRLSLEMRTSRRREAETVLLLLLGRALARCATTLEVAVVLTQRFRSLYQADAWLLVPQQDGSWVSLPGSSDPPPFPDPGQLLPELGPTALREDPLEPLFREECTYLALTSTRGMEGLLQIRRHEGLPFPQETWGPLQAFAVQGALAMERIRWLETAQRAHTDRETERLRNSLLSAISHDLRTPLAAIQGAASSLLLPAEPLPEATRRDMLVMIHDESERLARLLANLLDLTRLESGAIRARKEWQPLDEVVGAALRRMETGQRGPEVRVMLPKDLPLVPLDTVLMEQLLINLLSNAQRHAPRSPVELEAWRGETTLELAVCDEGPGVPEAMRERIFDKFFRLPGGDGGVGLGLAICEAIARTHGGRIWVEPSPQGGASFRVSLPLEGEPPPPPAESPA